MSECENSVDFWVDELTHDINPEHFNHHENFIPYMHDDKISSFGNWMWNNGYNVGLANLQAKVNTYCVPQWISVKDRLPEKDGTYLTCNKNGDYVVWGFDTENESFGYVDYEYDEMYSKLDVWQEVKVTHWMPFPEPPESEVVDGVR